MWEKYVGNGWKRARLATPEGSANCVVMLVAILAGNRRSLSLVPALVPHGSLWFPMALVAKQMRNALARELCAQISYGSLWFPMVPYGSLWFPMALGAKQRMQNEECETKKAKRRMQKEGCKARNAKRRMQSK